ncbi:MAG: hypothetical protein EXQ52_12610 [Bryobacterales bacterium]|nr:hypothetical protein [Bryobacterales bacterium]
MHPTETELALYAGGDLAWTDRFRVGKHVGACRRCREEAGAFAALRASAAGELRDMPEVTWNRLAAEMKANIRLGLEAGACVTETSARWPVFAFLGEGFLGRAAALASLAFVLTAGVWMAHRETPPPGVILQASGEGIEMVDGERGLSLMNGRTADVTYSVSAQGGVRARYVDSDTGYVTINHVYAQ